MLCGCMVDQDPCPMEEDKNHLERKVPSSQTSLYRLLWGEYHVNRPLFTGRPSGLGILGKCQAYRSLFTNTPLQVPGLPISPDRSHPEGRWQKKVEHTTCPKQKLYKTETENCLSLEYVLLLLALNMFLFNGRTEKRSNTLNPNETF
jgi:hypothetical protein